MLWFGSICVISFLLFLYNNEYRLPYLLPLKVQKIHFFPKFHNNISLTTPTSQSTLCRSLADLYDRREDHHNTLKSRSSRHSFPSTTNSSQFVKRMSRAKMKDHIMKGLCSYFDKKRHCWTSIQESSFGWKGSTIQISWQINWRWPNQNSINYFQQRSIFILSSQNNSCFKEGSNLKASNKITQQQAL